MSIARRKDSRGRVLKDGEVQRKMMDFICSAGLPKWEAPYNL